MFSHGQCTQRESHSNQLQALWSTEELYCYCWGIKRLVTVRIFSDAQFLLKCGVFLPFREAESFKEQGNAYYAKKDYNEAYNYYTKAIGEKRW